MPDEPTPGDLHDRQDYLLTLRYLTRAEAAEYARVSVATIDRARASGALSWGGAGGAIRILRLDVDSWLQGRNTHPQEG